MCFVGAAFAADTGGLRITITGNGGQPLAGATVKVSSPSSLVSRTGVTSADGSVSLNGLDPATNYTVEVVAPGYNNFSANNVAVVSDKNLSLGYRLGGGSADATNLDTVVVTGTSLAAVDTTSATVGTTLTLDMVESLPTGRSYQSYLQLVPGVKPSPGGNPSSKSGVNYSDIGGASGASSDNVYFLDGVDVTDHQTGTFGANFNSEIIQEQQVLTGGVPAEYAGGSGLISKVVTKSGSDEFHGSINYYLQNDNLVAKDKHNTSGGFSTYDAAVTLGGPIIKERLWFFGSFQKKFREDEVTDTTTGNLMRKVESDSEFAFLKATWQITDNDRLTGTFFNDPTDISGSRTATTLNNRDFAQVQGGDNYKLEYTHDWDNLRLNAYGFRHEGEVSQIPAVQDVSLNNVAFRGIPSTLATRSQGGGGTALITERNRDEFGLSMEYWLDTSFGSHAFKAGFTTSENLYFEDSIITGPDHARYSSIALGNAGVSFAEFVGAGWSGTRSIVTADAARIIGTTGGFGIANASAADKAYFTALLDTNNNGVVSTEEINAYKFTSTAGNPTGQVNNYRIVEVSAAPYTVESKGKTFFLQDTWTLNQWTVNAGVRAEEWKHYDSTGGQSAKFDWEFAPRVSVVYDLNGDGRSKVWGFFGRYYDPIRTNMSDFAGNLTGPELHEQIFLGDRWLTFRSRGGPKTPDALFAPSTKTPYTDEFLVGFSTTFRDDIGLSVIITKRRTRDILEDYDLGLYSDPTVDSSLLEPVFNLDALGNPVGPQIGWTPTNFGYAGPGTAYYLPYSYFGYTSQPNSNYVIGTLAGGKRDYTGFEVTLQKFKTENWQGMVSYTYNGAKGNTNSDSNADFQGDWIALDPRAPNIYGPQAGNIKHQLKGFASYEFDFGLELAGVFNWNSGLLYTTSQLISGRWLPIMDDAEHTYPGGPNGLPIIVPGYQQGGVWDTWAVPGAVGANTGPSYYTLDVRATYDWKLPFGKLELFLDVFNILDKQMPITEMGLLGGSGAYAFGDANSWVAPRRAYLGARYSF
ncbi:MAG: TonB-dependent receptor [Lysobacteraceae bacterium]|nr:MAG: TonB-dependent receptor [Xanthomonadaceae bacterium]